MTTAVATDHDAALRFITCGSVDDGKSTLIGRLLVDSRVRSISWMMAGSVVASLSMAPVRG